MDLYLLDSEFRRIGYVEGYQSALWVLRYAEYGDFEIHTDYNSLLRTDLNAATYVLDRSTNTAMFVESREYETNAEGGPDAIFKGRSLESMLLRRIVWNKKTIKGPIQDIIYSLLVENVISPNDADRKISNFIFRRSNDTRLKDYKVDPASPIELNGDNLYDTIKYLCDLFDVGFRITLNNNNQFVFELYCGNILDGSREDKRRVLFSPKMENLANSRYLDSSENYKNITKIVSTYEFKAEQDNDKDDDNASSIVTASTASWVVAPRSPQELTQFVGKKITIHFNKKIAANATLNLNRSGAKPLYYKNNRIPAEAIESGTEMVMKYEDTSGGRWILYDIKENDPPIEQSRVLIVSERDNPPLTGLERREIFTDANSISTEDGMTPTDYANSMKLQGRATLRDNRWETQVDGESIPDVNYIFGKDYNVGDIVNVENEVGIVITTRIVELVQTSDENGLSACPTFSSVYS